MSVIEQHYVESCVYEISESERFFVEADATKILCEAVLKILFKCEINELQDNIDYYSLVIMLVFAKEDEHGMVQMFDRLAKSKRVLISDSPEESAVPPNTTFLKSGVSQYCYFLLRNDSDEYLDSV